MWTYGSITEALHHRTILLRVHTTPLTPVSGSGGSSGFTARNSAFKGLNAEQYGQAVSGLRGERGWAEGPYMRDLIVDHINGVVRKSAPTLPRGHTNGNGPHYQDPLQVGQLPRRPWTRANFPFHSPRSSTTMPMRPDDLTPWISTTANLDWALWYIARLLTQHQHQPSQSQRPTGRQVYLTIISISTNRTENQELYVAPFLYHNLNNKHQLELRGKNEIDRARYNRASRNAVLAKEVLFYGRILGESILATTAFTPDVRLFFFHRLFFRLRCPLLIWSASNA